MSKKLPRDVILQQQQRAEEFRVRREVVDEENRVKFLLQKLKMPKKKWDMLNYAKSRSGTTPRLTLALFDAMCPNFPVKLAMAPREKVTSLHTNNKATLSSLFQHFTEAPFVQAYSEFYEIAEPEANGRAVGLLFSYKGIAHGLVIHDGEGLQDYWIRGLKMVYAGGTREKPKSLYVQSFVSMVEAIHDNGRGWKPMFAF